jgi:methylenetetrahydrofolate dehydrogenase (NAD+)
VEEGEEQTHHHRRGASIVDVTDLALQMRRKVRSYVRSVSENIRLVGILAESSVRGSRDDAEVYSERIRETFEEDGLAYELHRCQAIEPADVEAAIRHMNERPDVHGILVFYPIFKHLQQRKGPYLNQLTGVYYKTYDDYFRDVVSPAKDVEGLCGRHRDLYLKSGPSMFRARGLDHRLNHNEVYIPCTVSAVLNILETYHPLTGPPDQRWKGCTVTVINRSIILGRPLAALLALQGASVFSVDEHSILQFGEGKTRRCSDTMTMEQCVERSQAVVTGVPGADFRLPPAAIQPGTTVIDVSEQGNVDEETVLQRPDVKLIHHVGKVTVAALEENLIRLHQRSVSDRNKRRTS